MARLGRCSGVDGHVCPPQGAALHAARMADRHKRRAPPLRQQQIAKLQVPLLAILDARPHR
eukprot:2886390-Prymnesium_polylepis.1